MKLNTLYYLKIAKSHIKKWHIFAVSIFLFVFFDGILLLNNFQNVVPIVGLRFEGENVSFLGMTKLEKIIVEKATVNNRPLTFSYKDKKISVYPSDVGYSVNSSFMVNKSLLVGRQGNIFQKLITQTRAMFGLEDIKLSGNISRALLTLELLQIKDQISHDPIPIHPDFASDMLKTIPAKSGIQIDLGKLRALIVKNISHPPQKPISLPVGEITPIFHAENELAPLREQAFSLTQSSISISSGGQIFTLTPKDLKAILVVVERPNPNNPKKTRLVLRLEDRLLNQQLGIFAAKVETLTHSEFDDHDARAAIYAQFYSGKHETAIIPTGQTLRAKNVLGVQNKPGPKTAYLTFDDGPNTIYHPLILDILKQYNAHATFFLVGQNINSAHDPAIRTLTDGHLVGNHSLTHSFLPNFSSPFIFNELDKTDNILKSINGNNTVLFFRPPYGGINTYVVSNAHKLGLRVFLWDVDPRDWSEPSTDDLVQRVVGATHDGSDILLHSNHLATVRALPRIIENLRSQGYTFKTLDAYPRPEQLW